MAAYGWRSDRSVADWLYAEGYQFNFYQAVRLIETLRRLEAERLEGPARERHMPVPVGEGVESARESVNFRSHVSLGFPPSDVVGIEPPTGAGAPATIEVSFMGLAGALGPLPRAITEVLIERLARHDTALRDFLDIFNHRLIALHYRARFTNSVALDPRSPEQTPFTRYLYSLAGLGTDGLRRRMSVRERAFLHYAGLLSNQVRSAAGLEVLIEGQFGVQARVVQFVGGWHRIDDDQLTRIGDKGQNHTLGQEVVLGTRVWSDEQAVAVVLGPLSLERYLTFLPDGTAWAALRDTIRFYLRDTLEFEIRLVIESREVPELSLRHAHGAKLGWTSWLRSTPLASAPEPLRLRHAGTRHGHHHGHPRARYEEGLIGND